MIKNSPNETHQLLLKINHTYYQILKFVKFLISYTEMIPLEREWPHQF